MNGVSDPWTPQGAAARDHFEGRRPAVVRVHSVGGGAEDVDAACFFRNPGQMDAWELRALQLCDGRVLDIGAGAGCHALALQEQRLDVVAVDTCPAFVEVMMARGVVDARCMAPSEVDDGPFDRLLLLMHGLGIAGDADGLRWLLADAHRLVTADGMILLDSRDPGEACDEPGLGVAELRLEYAGEMGPPFPWLFAGAEALERIAADVGWGTEVVLQEADGRYLARLNRL
jgi:SAM-dependent methyltransferase